MGYYISENERAESQLAEHNSSNGSTFHRLGNLKNSKHWSVGIKGSEKIIKGKLGRRNLIDYYRQVNDENKTIGTWYDDVQDLTFLDTVILFDIEERESAIKYGKINDQIAIFNLQDNQVLFI